MKLGGLSDGQLNTVDLLYKAEKDRRRREFPSKYFPWHRIQKWILEVAEKISGDLRMIFVAGGNRGGKSKVGMGTVSEMLRRISPLNKQLLTTDKYTGEIRVKDDRDPLTIWIVPPTLEKARLDWMNPQDQMGLKYWCGNLYIKTRLTPDTIIYSRPPGTKEEDLYSEGGKLDEDLCDKILIKSQDQDFKTFESSEVDLIIFDEEPTGPFAVKIWNSCRMRIGTTHGILMMTYTPLSGLSWSFKKFWKRMVNDGMATEVADRCWVFNPTKEGEEGEANIVCAQMGSADNPRARSYAKEIEVDPSLLQAEKDARLYGKYGFVEGALLPRLAGLDIQDPTEEHEVYVVDNLPGDLVHGVRIEGFIHQWLLVADPNKSYGATLACLDGNDNLYFISEHLEKSWPDRRHAAAMKDMERDHVAGPIARYADPGSAGAQSIINMADLGLDFDTMPKGAGSVGTSIKKFRGMTFVDPEHSHPITGKMGAPRVYFFRPGLLAGEKKESELANQISEARQTDNESAPVDTPHKDHRSHLDLFDCGRYTANIIWLYPPPADDPRHGLGKDPDRIRSDEAELGKLDAEPVSEHEFYSPVYDFEENHYAGD